jgi:TRAP-type C4-dicarboxylate transport system permease small subunit
MTRELRWRILTLQIIVTIVFAFGAGVGLWAYNFSHNQVRDQLTAQKIPMPDKATLTPSEYSQADIAALAPYSGTMMDTGDKAKAYADHYLGVHLKGMGYTYSQISAKYMELTTVKKLPPTNPQVQSVGGLRNTIFMGTMLKSSLLQAWAFWFVGSIALYAAIGLAVASVVAFLAFLFELFIARKPEDLTTPTSITQRVAV